MESLRRPPNRSRADICGRQTTSLGREIFPKVRQTRIAAEQRHENGGVCEQYVARAVATWWHPQEHVELFISSLNEWMRFRHVDRLPGQHSNASRVFRGDGIVWQVHVKDERCDV